MVVFFDAEDLAFIVAGKRWWVEDDTIEFAALTGEAFQPVEGVTFTEIVVSGVEIVSGKIVFSPIEINLGKI